MNELTKILLNIRSLRSFARDNLTIEQCEEALDKLSQVVAERQQIAQEEQAANAEREAKLKEYAAKAYLYFQQAEEKQKKGDWAGYGEELNKLRELLKIMKDIYK